MARSIRATNPSTDATVRSAPLDTSKTPEYASRSLQPVTVPLSLAAIGAFYLLSVRIAAIRQPTARRLIVPAACSSTPT